MLWVRGLVTIVVVMGGVLALAPIAVTQRWHVMVLHATFTASLALLMGWGPARTGPLPLRRLALRGLVVWSCAGLGLLLIGGAGGVVTVNWDAGIFHVVGALLVAPFLVAGALLAWVVPAWLMAWGARTVIDARPQWFPWSKGRARRVSDPVGGAP